MLRFIILSIVYLACVSVRAQLTADFTANVLSGCRPVNTVFTDNSTGSGINYRKWVFGNGNFSEGNNTQVGAVYNVPGTYNVMLIVSNGVETDTIIKQNYITVFRNPQPNFSIDVASGCIDLEVNISDLTVLGDAPISQYIWDFGDGLGGNFSSMPVSHTYTNPGIYSLILTTVDANGCLKTKDSIDIITASGPNVSFSASPTLICEPPGTSTFTNFSTGNGPFSFQWNFGNGDTGTSATETSTYTAFGLYSVSLIVTDNFGCRDTAFYPNYIKVDDLKPEWETPDSIYCPKTPIEFYNISNGAYATTWDFGDGTTFVGQNPPLHVYQNPGTYIVTITGSLGTCSASFSKPIYIENVQADINLLEPVICFPGLFLVEDNSSSDFGNVSGQLTVFSELSSLNVGLYNMPQGDSLFFGSPKADWHSLTYIVTSDNGCVDTLYLDSVLQQNKVEAEFAVNDNLGCEPFLGEYTDQSTPADSIVSWVWSFGDGDSAFVQNPTHTFMVGSYAITLTATSAGGCSDSHTESLNVGVPPYELGFSISDTLICVKDPLLVQDTSKSDTIINWVIWSFNGTGAPASGNGVSTSISFSEAGIYSLTLESGMNGCTKDSTYSNVIEVVSIDPYIKKKFECEFPNQLELFNPYLDAAVHRWYWDLGDGSPIDSTSTSIIHTYAPGEYWAYLTVFDPSTGCDNVDSLYVDFRPNTAILDIADSILCKRDSVFIDLSYSTLFFNEAELFYDANNIEEILPGGPSSLNVNFRYGWKFNQPGLYEILFVTYGIFNCGDTLRHSVQINAPIANFQVDSFSTCDPYLADFTDLTVSNLPITSWNWNFGNGLTSTVQNPQNILYTTGIYSVTLTVEDSMTCRDTRLRFNYIQAKLPPTYFNTNDREICAGDSVEFINLPIGNYTYLWDYGDGQTSTSDYLYHTYDSPGLYTIRLTLYDNAGCDSTFVQNNLVRVYANPIASVTTTPTQLSCYPVQVNFIDTIASPGATMWIWDFGDGGTVTTTAGPSAINTYNLPGDYTITLIVSNNIGCRDTLMIDNYISIDGPVVNFLLPDDTVCIFDDVEFIITSSSGINEYTWDFGDGTVTDYPAGQNVVSHAYSQVGYLFPQLLFSDTLGVCSIVYDTAIFVDQTFTDFIVNSDTAQCVGVSFSFSENSSANVDEWNWDFGDGFTASGQSVSHIYNIGGIYNVILQTLDHGAGCVGTKVYQVLVWDLPPVNAGTNFVVCTGDSVQIQATGGLDYLWQFSNSLSALDVANPYATPIINETYYLAVTDINGCVNYDSVSAEVKDLPVVSAGSDLFICTNQSGSLTATGAMSYSWSPVDNLSNPNSSNTNVLPADSMVYIVEGTDVFGCINYDTIWVQELYLPAVEAGTLPEICAGESVQLNGSGDSIVNWTPSTGLNFDTIFNPVSNAIATTNYILTVIAQNGCFNQDSVLLIVNDGPEISINGNLEMCVFDSVSLEAFGGVSYVWSSEAALSSSTGEAILAYPDTTTEITVVGTDSEGCIGWDTVVVVVNPLPVINSGGQLSYCIFESGEVSVSGGISYSWVPDTAIVDLGNGSFSFSGLASGSYVLLGVDANSCENTDVLNVNVWQLPNVQAGVSGPICKGDTATLTASGASNYLWNNGQDLNNKPGAQVITHPDYSLYNYVQGTDNNGCINRDSIWLVVYPLPQVNMPPQSICLGDTMQLKPNDVVGGHFNWSPNVYISDTTIQKPFTWTDSSMYYFIAVSDTLNCENYDSVWVQVHRPIQVVFPEDTMVFAGFPVDITIIGQGTYLYQWSPPQYLSCTNCSSTTVTPMEEMVYSLSIKDSSDCFRLDTTITVKLDPNFNVYVPNAFTPDGDGINDIFKVENAGMVSLKYLKIFDRWGEQLFYSTVFERGWDGTFRSKPCEEDVYIYQFAAVDALGNEVKKTGHVSLVR